MVATWEGAQNARVIRSAQVTAVPIGITGLPAHGFPNVGPAGRQATANSMNSRRSRAARLLCGHLIVTA
ncbi:hypothetical protein SBRY_10946 [Actinacidiphila bryophytorum]|uniref:Uncharacterized protein n=1 Tax=Actinacidiphila bryophytorum TaxID=1436133 RepID=A0A9W4E6Q0_9ACTN|nr:hypothetical protein SBRY_10946 [Actinacidiphila bryophytorum]